MQLHYGSYIFDANTSLISTREETLFNRAEQPYAIRRTVDVTGYLSGAGQGALTVAMAALATALDTQNQDLVFYQDDGNVSGTFLLSSGSISGVKITRGPDYTTTQGPEYATERHFSFSAEAEYPITGSNGLLLEFEETLSFEGGGYTTIHRASLNGPPQKQLLYLQTPYHVIQSGMAVGYRSYPIPPAPIFPAALKRQYPSYTRKSPRRRGQSQAYEGFAVTWSYEFESALPLVGSPNFWK